MVSEVVVVVVVFEHIVIDKSAFTIWRRPEVAFQLLSPLLQCDTFQQSIVNGLILSAGA
jgi:hypothetical protein